MMNESASLPQGSMLTAPKGKPEHSYALSLHCSIKMQAAPPSHDVTSGACHITCSCTNADAEAGNGPYQRLQELLQAKCRG